MGIRPEDCPLGPEWFEVMYLDPKTGNWHHCVCVECDVDLTPENYAHHITERGEELQPWEDPDTFDVARRVADTTELICFDCWLKWMGDRPIRGSVND